MIQKVIETPIMFMSALVESITSHKRSVWDEPIIKDPQKMRAIPVMVRR